MHPISPQEVLDFWFSETSKQLWFKSTKEFDQIIKSQYEELWEDAAAGYLDNWQLTASHALALVIILDQFPLNMFRGDAKSFATEAKAIQITRYTVEHNLDKELPKSQLSFLYMPLMHSENIDDQNLSINLFAKANLESNLRFAKHHHEIIDKFGRFPHRNAILGRNSTNEELDYLTSPTAFKG